MTSQHTPNDQSQIGDDGELQCEKFCVRCGTVNILRANYCSNCGTAFETDNTNFPINPQAINELPNAYATDERWGSVLGNRSQTTNNLLHPYITNGAR